MASKTATRRYTPRQNLALAAALEVLLRRAPLIRLLAMREIRDRYAGSMLGITWSVLQPLLLMLVLITIFGHVFGAKRPGITATSFDFIGYMIAGYVPWLMTSAALQAAVSVIRLNPGLVRQITFPVAVLPAKAVFAQAPMLLVGLAVYFVYALVEGIALSPLLLLLPVVVAAHVVLTLGLAWVLAALGTYFRDLDPILANLLMVNVFLLPIFLPPDAIPAVLAPIIAYNPFTPLIDAYQDVLVFGTIRSGASWLVLIGFALAAFTGGYGFFRRVRSGFGDLV